MFNVSMKALLSVTPRNERTHEEQIELLDLRLGEGVGAQKERTKLVLAILDRDGGPKQEIARLRRKLFDLKMEAQARKALRKFGL